MQSHSSSSWRAEGKLVFHIPMRGSLLLLFGAAAIDLLVALAIGLFISTMSTRSGRPCSSRVQPLTILVVFAAVMLTLAVRQYRKRTA